MKLSTDSVEFSNFLSFGKVPQKLFFEPGINIVTGLDSKTERSNGSGKSSLLESIPFALFGRINKSVRKENIINWKNKRNCWVSLKFKKGNNVYEIRRGIKPDFLEITENNVSIPQPSDVRIFQKTLENEILQFDYYTFQSLSSINLNSYVPILRMQSVQKRQFLERVFGLEVYSMLNDKVNKKLKKTEDSIYKFKLNQDSIKKIQNDLLEQNRSLENQLNNIGHSSGELNETIEIYNEILLEHPNPEQELDELDIRFAEIKKEIYNMNIDYENLKKEEMNRFFDIIDNKEQELEKSIKETNDLLINANNRVTITKERLSNLKKTFDLIDGQSECPTCRGVIKGGYDTQVKFDIDDLTSTLKGDVKKVKDLTDQLTLLKNEKSQLNAKRKKLSIHGIETEKMKLLKSEIIVRKTSESILEESIKEMKSIVSRTGSLKHTIDLLTEQVKKETATRESIQAIIDTNTKKLNELNIEHKTYGNKVKNQSILTDYFEYIKIICKDDNIKQYAISSIVPYLTKQTNHYLSDVGSNFYVKFDNWLDETIEGPGIYNCTYGNLSGAESKSIDLAVTFAFLDVARIQAGLFPDVLILDELLDSSVDGTGLSNILNIIKRRQKDDDSKVFLITHRKEISDIDADRVYSVEKKDGYSYIKGITGG